MRGHGAHVWMCAAVIAGALVVLFSTGDAFAFLPVIGCVLMMVVMMQLMGGMGRGNDRNDETG